MNQILPVKIDLTLFIIPEEFEEQLVDGVALSPAEAGEAAGEALAAAPARVAVRHARPLRGLLRLVLQVQQDD